MKILVVSDTHIPALARQLPKGLLQEISCVDACIHCGDFIDYAVYEQLSSMTTVYAVCGNMDEAKIRKNLPSRRVVTLEGVTFGITHGGGSPVKIIETVTQRFKEEFAEIDIFIFGHSHQTLDKTYNNKLYFNPGSPTDTLYSSRKSYGIIELTGSKIERRLVFIE